MKIEIWPLIHNWHLFCLQKCSLPLKNRRKNFFLTPLEKSKKFENSKIFNNIGSHDGMRKKIYQNRQNAANHTLFLFTLYISTKQLKIQSKLILFISILLIGKCLDSFVYHINYFISFINLIYRLIVPWFTSNAFRKS